MYGNSNIAPAVGAVAGGSAAAATQTGGAAVLAFTGAALASYFAVGLLLLAAGAVLRRLSRPHVQHS